MTVTYATRSSGRPWHAIFIGGFIAATLDLAGACAQAYALSGRTPDIILQSIASGILGAPAFQGGWSAAALGAAAHYFIIFVAAALLWIASRRVRFITARPWVAGPLYGAMIFAFMNSVVVPLSNAPFELKYTPFTFALQLFFHIFFVGATLALATRHYSR
jgi:hypothetical protein